MPTSSAMLGVRAILGQFDVVCRAGALRSLVVVRPGEVEFTEVRSGFAAHVTSHQFSCWQDAWDSWVEQSNGVLDIESWRCEGCDGRRFNRRTGQVCTTCMGRGTHLHRVRVRARRAPRPD